MTELPPIFVPELGKIPSEQDRIQKAIKQVVRTTDERTRYFDSEVVGIIALIANALCNAGYLRREPLIEQFQEMSQKAPAWVAQGSLFGAFADTLEELVAQPSGGKPDIARLFDVIEGGLSKKKEDEPAD